MKYLAGTCFPREILFHYRLQLQSIHCSNELIFHRASKMVPMHSMATKDSYYIFKFNRLIATDANNGEIRP